MTVQIGIIGAAEADPKLLAQAEEMGILLGKKGWILICGGLTGVMEAAARGAKARGGVTVGILPGQDRKSANPYIDIALPTNLGHARNAVIAQSADALVAIGGGWGTLSEMALARKMGKTVISLGSWKPAPDVETARTPREALEKIEKAIG